MRTTSRSRALLKHGDRAKSAEGIVDLTTAGTNLRNSRPLWCLLAQFSDRIRVLPMPRAMFSL
jgi:hypothetical protein